jgi:tetratricopeptide (TPR) repeat protein
MKIAVAPAYARRLAALLILSCVTCAAARRESFYEVEGVVYGPGSQPLPGIVVFLEDVTRARVGQSITGSDGRYRFSRVAAGTYFIVVRPTDGRLQPAVHRLELINSARGGGVASSSERVDIMIGAVPRRAAAAAGTLFAQDVPGEAEAEYERALESLGKKDRARAAERLKRALKIFPDYFDAAQQLGLLYVEGEQFGEAMAPLVKAIEVNPKAAPSYLGLGIASISLGRPDLALDALEHARQLDAKSYRVHFYLGLALTDLNRLDEAVVSLKEAHRLGVPAKFGAARLYLASVYTRRGQRREAAAELETYLAENPNAANAANVREAVRKLKAQP